MGLEGSFVVFFLKKEMLCSQCFNIYIILGKVVSLLTVVPQ